VTDTTQATQGQPLLPCPHCGGEPKIVRLQEYGDYYVDCDCSAIYRTKEESIAAWNRRAANDLTQQQAQRIAELEQQLAAARAERRYVPAERVAALDFALDWLHDTYHGNDNGFNHMDTLYTMLTELRANVQACTERSERGSEQGEE
jgi:hypothetical protein